MATQFLTSADIAGRSGAALRTVLKWAINNDVSYLGSGRRKIYVWSEDDYSRFLKRPKPGKRAKEKAKTEGGT